MNMTQPASQPSVFYKNLEDFLLVDNLSNKEKLKILQDWKQTCMQLQECTYEGMSRQNEIDNEGENLRRVSEALNKLKCNW